MYGAWCMVHGVHGVGCARLVPSLRKTRRCCQARSAWSSRSQRLLSPARAPLRLARCRSALLRKIGWSRCWRDDGCDSDCFLPAIGLVFSVWGSPLPWVSPSGRMSLLLSTQYKSRRQVDGTRATLRDQGVGFL